MTKSTDPFKAIANIVSDKNIITNDDQTPYLTEWRQRWPGKAAMIITPENTAQLSQIVKLCAAHKIPVTPQGGNTGLVGGQIPSGPELLVSMKKMRTIHEISPLDNCMIVDAGLTLLEAQEAAKEQNRLFPLSIGSEGSCQIGGILSTNAGGVNVLRYGNSRDLVLGLEAVLPNGEIWNGIKKLRKDNTGYDLKQLFIGGEGTLGIITKAALKLYPVPVQTQTIMAACPHPQAVIELLSLMQSGSGGQISSFEFMERLCIDLVLRHVPNSRDPFSDRFPVYALIELSAGDGDDLESTAQTLLAIAMEKGLIADAVIAANDTQRKELWHLRHTISGSLNGEGIGVRNDVSVPTSVIPQFLAQGEQAVKKISPDARIAAFGHVGDGNVHYDIIPAQGAPKNALDDIRDDLENAVYDVIDRFDGSISAEHGIGTHKRTSMALRKSPTEMSLMRAIKKAIDPDGIMNPGKML